MTYDMLCTSSPEKAHGFIKEWVSRTFGGVFEVLCIGFYVIALHWCFLTFFVLGFTSLRGFAEAVAICKIEM